MAVHSTPPPHRLTTIKLGPLTGEVSRRERRYCFATGQASSGGDNGRLPSE